MGSCSILWSRCASLRLATLVVLNGLRSLLLRFIGLCACVCRSLLFLFCLVVCATLLSRLLSAFGAVVLLCTFMATVMGLGWR